MSADALRSLVKENFRTQQKFAEILGVDKGTVSRWLNGKTPLTRAIQLQILDAVPGEKPSDASPRSSVLGTDTRFIPVERVGFKIVPIYGSVPAGSPGKTFNDAIEYMYLPDWGGNHDRWGKYVAGPSMEEEFLHGDRVVFEDQQIFHTAVVYATKDDEEAFKVYIERPDGTRWLCPINQDFQPFSAEDWTIWGVCIRRERETGRGRVETVEVARGFTAKL